MAGRHPNSHVPTAVSVQEWADVALLHWRVDPELVQAQLPASLTVDTHDGDAWVSLTPFQMRHARAPWLPHVPWLSNYPEWNVRTYVRGPDSRDGLWFFSLDVARLPVVVGMRAAVGLPYAWSAMSLERTGDTVAYRCQRKPPWGELSSHVVVRFGALLVEDERSELDDWLAGRWRAYSRVAGRWVVVEVVHEPWPLRDADLVAHTNEIVQAAVPLGDRPPDLVRVADGVHARLGPPRLVAAHDV